MKDKTLISCVLKICLGKNGTIGSLEGYNLDIESKSPAITKPIVIYKSIHFWEEMINLKSYQLKPH